MKLSINEAKIKEACGVTAYKKGKSYFQAGKVILRSISNEHSIVQATVLAGEEFDVKVQDGPKGQIVATCSCPPVGFVKTYCQHVAAVLFAIEDYQQMDDFLATRMMNLFDNKTKHPTGRHSHFERRKPLDLEFTCHPIEEEEGYIIEMELGIGTHLFYPIENIEYFFHSLQTDEPYKFGPGFTYSPEVYSFPKETDEVLQLLLKCWRGNQENMILITPSDWEHLLPLLAKAPFVQFNQNGHFYPDIQFSQELPISFTFGEGEQERYELHMKGLTDLLVFPTYHGAYSRGTWYKLPMQDAARLVELKAMVETAEKPMLMIKENQIDDFMNKVIPGLMRLGKVKISDGVSSRLNETPLTVKLFLDRVKNKLLAGVEFHYGHMMVNPSEETEETRIHLPGIRRQRDREQEFLELLIQHSFTQTPGGFLLYDEEAEYQFLYHVLPHLEKWVKVYASTAVKIRVNTGYRGPKIEVEVKERTDWLEFQFDFNEIPQKEIEQLMTAIEEKQKFYRIPGGNLVSLETPEYLALTNFLEEMKYSLEDALESERVRVPLIKGMQFISSIEREELVERGEAFAELLTNLQQPHTYEEPVPKTLELVLRDYQKAGFTWLKLLARYQFGGILADDMGLGKTLQSIAFIDSMLSEIKESKQPVLIVSPASLIYNWQNEIEKFTPHIQATVIAGNKSVRQDMWNSVNHVDVVITSYPTLRMDEQLHKEHRFHTMFLDEAQAVKNPDTKTARVVRKVKANHRFALTGTPIENSISELWSIFRIVFPELLPNRREFHDLQRSDIAKRVRPFILRRTKEEVLKELPNKKEKIVYSELQLEQKKLYTAYLAELKHDALKHLKRKDFRKNKVKFLAGLTRLRQLCCHPALFVEDYKGSSAKLEQLIGILKESRLSGRRVLIFSQFTQMLGIIGKQLVREGVPYFYLDGQTPPKERVELCDRFNQGESELFLISLKAGGTGLNLTGADTVILYDLWWNPAVEQQAADRAHRMGQQKEVQVIRMVAKGTIEEKITQLQHKKKSLIDDVIQSGAEGLTEEDILEVLME